MIVELLLKLPPPPDPISSPKHPQASVTSSLGCCGAYQFQNRCAPPPQPPNPPPAGAAPCKFCLEHRRRSLLGGGRASPSRASQWNRPLHMCSPFLGPPVLAPPPSSAPASRNGVARLSHCVWKEDSCKLAGSNDLLGVSCGSVFFAWGGGVQRG